MTKALELAKFGRESAPAGLVVGDSDAQTLSQKTFSDMPVFSAGTVNGVAYLNGSKVLTAGSALVFDGTNFGVGTASPSAKLHVSVAGDNETVIARFGTTSTGSVTSQLKVLSDPSTNTVKFDATGSSSQNYSFMSGGTERMRLASTGDIGIGTTPNSNGRLTVYETTVAKLFLTDSTLGTTYGGQVRGYGTTGAGGYLELGVIDANVYNSAIKVFNQATQISLYTNSGTNGSTAERVRIDNNGNVVIGAASPYNSTTDKLTVIKAQSALTQVFIDNQSSNPAAGASLTLSAYGGGTSLSVPSATPGLNPFIITVNATERMRITSTGNVGIGTASPATTLHVYATDTSANRTSTYNAATITAESSQMPYTGFGPSLVFASRAYTSGVVNSTRITSEINNDSIVSYGGSLGFDVTATVGGSLYRAMTIRYNGYVGIGTNVPAVEFEARGRARVGDGTNTITSGYWDGVSNRIESVGKPLFLTSYNDSIRFGMSGSEQMRITPQGYVGIATTDPQSLLTINSGGTDNTAAATINQTTDFAATSRAGFSGLTNNNGGFYFGMGANGTGIPAGFGFFREASGWNTALAFYTNNQTSGTYSTRAMQEKMRLDSSGNLIIGGRNNGGATKALVQNGNGGGHPFIMQGGSIVDPVASTNYTVWTFAEYASTAFMLLLSYENNTGDGVNQSAIYVDAGTGSYGGGFSVTKLSGGGIFTVSRGGTTNSRTLQVQLSSGGGSGAILQWQLFLLASTQG